MNTAFPAWAPAKVVQVWQTWEQDHPDAYEQIPSWLIEQLPENEVEKMYSRRERVRDTKSMLWRLLGMPFMQEAWEVIEALDTGDRYSDRIAALVFSSVAIRAYWGPITKLEQMSPQRYDDWRNAVLRKIEELSALVERTDLDDLVKDELGSRDFKDALCAGRLSDYLRLAHDALSKPNFKLRWTREYSPLVPLAKPNDRHARRKYFALRVFNYLSQEPFETQQAKRVVVLATAAAFDIEDPTTIERQVYRYLQ